jgi:hypothetical protein
MKKKRAPAKDKPDQWTAMAEAISFISATLGEAFTSAQGHALYWSAFARLDDGLRGYPVGLENIARDKVCVTISFMAAEIEATSKLYAIIGWARYHGHEVEAD